MINQTTQQGTPDTTTANGLPAFSTTGSALVDLYYQMTRTIEESELVKLLEAAWGVDPSGTLRLIFQARDARGGKGDRDSFHLAFNWLINKDRNTALYNLGLIPEYGYWKDVVRYFNHPIVGNTALTIYVNALMLGNRLAYKWAPRGKNGSFVQEAALLQDALGITTRRAYLKFLSKGTDVVEQKMCSNQWEAIAYPSVPSVAMKNYRKAFPKHDPDRFAEFINKVKSGEVRIKAGQLYPYEIISAYSKESGPNEVLEAQWAELVRLVKELGALRALPVVDTSGSMWCPAAGNVSCADVAKSLGLLLSQAVNEPWTGMMIPFSSEAELILVEGDSLYDRLRSFQQFQTYEGYSTNVMAVFNNILRTATEFSLVQADLPPMVIMLTDGQFNQLSKENLSSVTELIKKQYNEAGYEPPVLVFWNLSSGYGNYPAVSNKAGTVFLSGFSPSALDALLKYGSLDASHLVNGIINSDRYSALTVVD